MKPVKLDSSSTKKKPAIGDILYSTADGKLTLNSKTNSVDNTAIAICVIPKSKEDFEQVTMGTSNTFCVARFVSLNYMSYETPVTGSELPQPMHFANESVTIGNNKTEDEESAVYTYLGGKWNTRKCLAYADKQDKNICIGITNSTEKGYCAPACCCVGYSPLGTKSGDWYLPTSSELYEIYANKTIINEKRKTIKGSDFENCEYWVSSEYVSDGLYQYEDIIDLTQGTWDTRLKNSSRNVLAFLTVEVPEN